MKLSDLEKRVLKKSSNYSNEEATKQGLIIPLLSLLGYDIHNMQEIQPEFTIKDLGKVDYALCVEGKVNIFIEAKKLGTNLIKHIDQLKDYYDNNEEVEVGILTDGNHYLFFSNIDNNDEMDRKPFLVLSIINNFRNSRVSTWFEFIRLTRLSNSYVESKIFDNEWLNDNKEITKLFKELDKSERELKGLDHLLDKNIKV